MQTFSFFCEQIITLDHEAVILDYFNLIPRVSPKYDSPGNEVEISWREKANLESTTLPGWALCRSVTWYKNTVLVSKKRTGTRQTKKITILDDVRSLVVLSQCVSCSPASCFCTTRLTTCKGPIVKNNWSSRKTMKSSRRWDHFSRFFS